MKLIVVPPSRGWHWARQGLQMCMSQPLGFVSLLGLVATLVMLLMALQLFGLIAVVVAMPALWMSFMLAVRRVIAGEKIAPSVLIEPWRAKEDRLRWLQLGGLYAAGTLLVVLISSWVGPDIEAISEVVEAGADNADLLADSVMLESMAWRALLALPLSLAFWHTPALMFWGRIPPVKALFFSAVASWRNLGAFAVYGLVWLGVLVATGLLVRVIGSVIPVPFVAQVATVFAGMWVASAFYASLYFTVVDCFEPKHDGLEGPGDLPGDSGSQGSV
ncbi:MAG: hypothetical protein RLZZ182_60 [Pseudomonadota bacterium]